MIHLEDEPPLLEDRIWRLEILHAFPELRDIVIRYYRQRPEKSEVKRIAFIYLYFKSTWHGRNRAVLKMPCKRSVELVLGGKYA